MGDSVWKGRRDRQRLRLTSAIPGWSAPTRKPLVGVLPGEGIGPEVMQVAVAVLRAVAPDIELRVGGAIGRESFRQSGAALSASVTDWCSQLFSEGGSLLCGPGGQRFVYDLRARFGLYCKLTPVRPVAALRDAGVVRPERSAGTDLVVVRENAGGIYFGKSERSAAGASQSFVYESEEVDRILAVAAKLAERRRGRVALVIKPGAMPAASELFLDRWERLAPGLDTRVLEVDNAAYQLVADPKSFDVVVAPNLFGDILSDCASALLGSRGLSYSGNFSGAGAGVYQTGHGCAHDLAGRGIANPVGQVLSVAMLLREGLGRFEASERIDGAIDTVLGAGYRTPDIAASGSRVVGTEELGERLVATLERRATSAGVPSRGSLPRRDPTDWERVMDEVPVASMRDVARACERADSAPPVEAPAALETVARTLEARAEEFARLIVRDIGKPVRYARAEVAAAVAHVRAAAGLRRGDGLRPHGAVALITPWNNPLAIPLGKIAPALAMGNRVVWKAAGEAPATARALVALLREAGVPAASLHLLFGDASTGRALIEDARIAAVSLTGSTATGRAAAERCIRLGKPVQAEMGGNNATVVLADFDFAAVARDLARSAFACAGQRCTATRRFLVERSVLPAFRDALVQATRALPLGDPASDRTEVGPMVSRERRDALRARLRGLDLLCGGGAPDGFERGCWIEPALLSLEADPTLGEAEVFGPAAVVCGVDDLDEAIRVADGVEHGLVATLLTNSRSAREHFAETVRAGILHFAPGPLAVDPHQPFGGWKASGIGPPEHGRWDREFYARPQARYGGP